MDEFTTVYVECQRFVLTGLGDRLGMGQTAVHSHRQAIRHSRCLAESYLSLSTPLTQHPSLPDSLIIPSYFLTFCWAFSNCEDEARRVRGEVME